ncbi:MAG: c-type cytochrome [Saprospiraceae bacterium]|nr:c-type cytochrome [Saprospiraceae bacterium]
MKKIIYLSCFAALVLTGCKEKIDSIGPLSPNYNLTELEERLDTIPYFPTAYNMPVIDGLPPVEVPADNPMTEEGVRLGRFLFYETELSIDNTVSCGSCHHVDKAFTDGLDFSIGVNGARTTRNSMSLINIAYSEKQNSIHNLMWDGSFSTLEQQILEGPVTNSLEMANTWEEVETRLRAHNHYPRMFRQAFGITDKSEINRELVAKAIAQFERTLNSAASRYDQHEFVPFEYMDEQELRGMQLFIGDAGSVNAGKDGECAHCHSFTRDKAVFGRFNFSNNGLDSTGNSFMFPDPGFGAVTGNIGDNGKFKEVTLRNIALTAPYMHDGRFNTLEEVMDHYVSIGHGTSSPNVSNELTTAPDLPNLTQQEQDDIVAFLHALTDTSYVNKVEWSDPFSQENPWQENQ